MPYSLKNEESRRRYTENTRRNSKRYYYKPENVLYRTTPEYKEYRRQIHMRMRMRHPRKNKEHKPCADIMEVSKVTKTHPEQIRLITRLLLGAYYGLG